MLHGAVQAGFAAARACMMSAKRPGTRIPNAGEYRRRAEKLRTLAEEMHDEISRRALLDVAKQYELMAATRPDDQRSGKR